MRIRLKNFHKTQKTASMGSGSGGMSLSNATSRDNPLASNAYQMAEHAKPSGRR